MVICSSELKKSSRIRIIFLILTKKQEITFKKYSKKAVLGQKYANQNHKFLCLIWIWLASPDVKKNRKNWKKKFRYANNGSSEDSTRNSQEIHKGF